MLMSDILSDLSTEELLDIYGVSDLPDDPETLEYEEESEAVQRDNLEYFYEMAAYMGKRGTMAKRENAACLKTAVM